MALSSAQGGLVGPGKFAPYGRLVIAVPVHRGKFRAHGKFSAKLFGPEIAQMEKDTALYDGCYHGLNQHGQEIAPKRIRHYEMGAIMVRSTTGPEGTGPEGTGPEGTGPERSGTLTITYPPGGL